MAQLPRRERFERVLCERYGFRIDHTSRSTHYVKLVSPSGKNTFWLGRAGALRTGSTVVKAHACSTSLVNRLLREYEQHFGHRGEPLPLPLTIKEL